ncbi:MAG: beta-lactamase family protein [Crocinitomicaceae bacterium]|nr:beta-lactamase family protein [Crocinitomicaceae bacterium]MBK8926693.1 beta-lactamase family protein [Crocinitomicaceae bacterium]
MKNILIILCIIADHCCLSQDTDQNNFANRVDEYMQAQSNINNFSGAILIAKNDSILFKGGYGIADREWNVPNTAETKFRIASNTKQFTAACILQLEEQGKLSLNDTLGKYFSGFEYGNTVTIHMLLTHSSGIQDYFQFKEFDLKPAVISKDSMVSLLKNKLFNFLPGTDLNYSNSNYFLLGMIIEKVSGESFENYLNKHILKIADMHNTGIDCYDTILLNRAKGYKISSNEYSNAFDQNYTWDLMFAVGSMYSTVEDIYHWDIALRGNDILSEASKNKMYYPYGFSIANEKKKADPSNTMPQSIDPLWYHLGYGVWVDTFMTHKRVFSRGGTSGFHSTIYRFVDENIIVIVLQNNEENPDKIAEPLSALVFGKDVVIPYKHIPYEIDPNKLKKYTGKWVGNIYDEKWEIELMIMNNKFFRRIEGYPDLELIPESDTKFFYADGQDKVFEFIENGEKEIEQAWFTVNGIRFVLNKI